MRSRNSSYITILTILLFFSVLALIEWTCVTLRFFPVGGFLEIPYVAIILVSPIVAFATIIYGSFGVIYQWFRPRQNWGLVGISAWVPLVLILISIAILVMCGYFWANAGFSD